MTAFDRIEHRLPELIDELASARIPEYFDDMLLAVAETRQRPSWSALERWLPMGVIARPAPIRAVPWRVIAVVAMLAILATATFAYVGSRTAKVAPPFGVAKNGALVIGTQDGHIATVDPVSGETTPLLDGTTTSSGPYFSPDGRRFIFDRLGGLWVANADGSAARGLFPAGTEVSTFDWSPDGERAVITRSGSGTVAIVDIASGVETPVAFDKVAKAASWRPNHDQLIVTEAIGGGENVAFWIVGMDGSAPVRIPASEFAIQQSTLSPDGTTLAYATWEPVVQGRIRAIDIDSEEDRPVTTDDADGYVWQAPLFSPDGTHLLVYRFDRGATTIQARPAVMDIVGGSAIAMGKANGNPQPSLSWSPDGQTIVVSYQSGETWMFDADGTDGRKVPFNASGGITWQRAALD